MVWWGHHQEIFQLEVAHPCIILQKAHPEQADACRGAAFILQHDGKEQSRGSEPKHCSLMRGEEPFSPCFIQPHQVICGCAGDFSIHLPPSAFRSLSTETACRWGFGRLTCIFRGSSFGAGVQMKSALPKHHSTSQFRGHRKVKWSSFENACSSLRFLHLEATLGPFLFAFILSIQTVISLRKGLWDLDLLGASGYNSNK